MKRQPKPTPREPTKLTEPVRYIIAGGGCYGSDYVRQLIKADERGAIAVSEIVVIDRSPSCAVSTTWSDDPRVRIICADWCDWIDAWWDRRGDFSEDRWVPPPIAPHIIFEWALKLCKRSDPLWTRTSWTDQPPAGFEFAEALQSGSLALSHAPGLCPVHCIEPAKCPLTGSTRSWEMRNSVRDLIRKRTENDGDPVMTFQCQHHAYGVGTIPFANIIRELERMQGLVAGGSDELAVATVSSCHGLVDLMTRQSEPGT